MIRHNIWVDENSYYTLERNFKKQFSVNVKYLNILDDKLIELHFLSVYLKNICIIIINNYYLTSLKELVSFLIEINLNLI